jgi:hypothetical protein
MCYIGRTGFSFETDSRFVNFYFGERILHFNRLRSLACTPSRLRQSLPVSARFCRIPERGNSKLELVSVDRNLAGPHSEILAKLANRIKMHNRSIVAVIRAVPMAEFTNEQHSNEIKKFPIKIETQTTELNNRSS